MQSNQQKQLNQTIKSIKLNKMNKAYQQQLNLFQYLLRLIFKPTLYNCSFFQMLRYIPEDKQHNLREFKYKGSSSSITYEYLWSPFAEYLLKFTPEWVAPNLITLVAFVIVLISHCVFMFWGGDQFGQPVSGWKCILMCVTIFVYQHLDNMDGKQARRTKNSTPVGMLFDHGADAITAVLFGLQLLCVFGVQSYDLSIFLACYFVLYPNFAGLWNQYSIGHFNLDRINPIDEGLPTYSLFVLFGAFCNYFQFFNTHHLFAKWNEQILLLIAITITFTVLKLHRDLFTNSLIRNKDDIIMKLLLPIILTSTLTIWKFFIAENIYTKHFHPIIYILTFMWGRNMMLMQVCYVTKQRFHSLNIGTLTFLVIWAVTSFLYISEVPVHIIHNFLIVAALVQLAVLMEFIVSFLNQAKTILGIKIFKINYQKPTTVKSE